MVSPEKNPFNYSEVGFAAPYLGNVSSIINFWKSG